MTDDERARHAALAIFLALRRALLRVGGTLRTSTQSGRRGSIRLDTAWRDPIQARGTSGSSPSTLGLYIEVPIHPLHVDRVFPPGNDHGSNTITYEIGQRARFRHEAVDAEDERSTRSAD
jgi:hypothetical protein